jgi:hypothetical protein
VSIVVHHSHGLAWYVLHGLDVSQDLAVEIAEVISGDGGS